MADSTKHYMYNGWKKMVHRCHRPKDKDSTRLELDGRYHDSCRYVTQEKGRNLILAVAGSSAD